MLFFCLLALLFVVALVIDTHSSCIFVNSLAAALLFNLPQIFKLDLQNSTY